MLTFESNSTHTDVNGFTCKCVVAYKDNFESELPYVGQDLSNVSLAGQPLPKPKIHLDSIARYQGQLKEQEKRGRHSKRYFAVDAKVAYN